MRQAKRERAALTAAAEKKLLEAMAVAMPAAINSDHLTVVGVIGAFGVGAGYALSILGPHWLWLASAMLVVNWFGDSLDGTLARIRKAERPRYGYYLDHGVDAFNTAMIGAGIGLSPFVPIELALVLVLLYLIMSINVYLEAQVYGIFKMDYGKIGPTETRILLIFLNAGLVLLIAGLEVHPKSIRAIATLLLSAAAAGMLLLLVWRFGRNLVRLAGLEPLHRGEATPGARTIDGVDRPGAGSADDPDADPAAPPDGRP